MLRRWELPELRRMREEMDRLWPFGGVGEEQVREWHIPLDVVEENGNIVVKAALPGVKPEDIEVTVEEDVLTIKGNTMAETEHRTGEYLMRERRTGTFQRSLRLPRSVDADQAVTSYELGVVTVTLPKQESQKAKRLTVTVPGVLETGEN